MRKHKLPGRQIVVQFELLVHVALIREARKGSGIRCRASAPEQRTQLAYFTVQKKAMRRHARFRLEAAQKMPGTGTGDVSHFSNGKRLSRLFDEPLRESAQCSPGMPSVERTALPGKMLDCTSKQSVFGREKEGAQGGKGFASILQRIFFIEAQRQKFGTLGDVQGVRYAGGHKEKAARSHPAHSGGACQFRPASAHQSQRPVAHVHMPRIEQGRPAAHYQLMACGFVAVILNCHATSIAECG